MYIRKRRNFALQNQYLSAEHKTKRKLLENMVAQSFLSRPKCWCDNINDPLRKRFLILFFFWFGGMHQPFLGVGGSGEKGGIKGWCFAVKICRKAFVNKLIGPARLILLSVVFYKRRRRCEPCRNKPLKGHMMNI